MGGMRPLRLETAIARWQRARSRWEATALIAAGMLLLGAIGAILVHRFQTDWMLTTGLWLYSASAVAQVARGWTLRGLTDLEVGPLGVLAIASGLIAAWCLAHGLVLTTCTAALPGALALWCLYAKMRDRRRARRLRRR